MVEAQQLNNTARQLLAQMRALSCSSNRKLTDAGFRRTAIVRAVWAALEAAGMICCSGSYSYLAGNDGLLPEHIPKPCTIMNVVYTMEQ